MTHSPAYPQMPNTQLRVSPIVEHLFPNEALRFLIYFPFSCGFAGQKAFALQSKSINLPHDTIISTGSFTVRNRAVASFSAFVRSDPKPLSFMRQSLFGRRRHRKSNRKAAAEAAATAATKITLRVHCLCAQRSKRRARTIQSLLSKV